MFVDYVENFKNKARERRFIIRNFSFDPNAAQARLLLFFNLDLHLGRLAGHTGSRKLFVL